MVSDASVQAPHAIVPSKSKTAPVNPSVGKDQAKVAHVYSLKEIEELIKGKSGTLAMCRCWRSKAFPFCDGTHTAYNKESGDNVGPLVMKLEKPAGAPKPAGNCGCATQLEPLSTKEGSAEITGQWVMTQAFMKSVDLVKEGEQVMSVQNHFAGEPIAATILEAEQNFTLRVRMGGFLMKATMHKAGNNSLHLKFSNGGLWVRSDTLPSTAPPELTSPLVNPSIEKEKDKVASIYSLQDIENLVKEKNGTLAMCRCWRSKAFPFCNGTHIQYNKECCDNVGPLVIKAEK